MPRKTPNIEYYPSRSKQYRIRFNIDNKLKSFGYYESFDDALMLRNLIAGRIGVETAHDDLWAEFSDDDFARFEDDFADLLDAASALGEHKMTVISSKKERVPTWKLQEEINELSARIGDLESQLRLVLQRLNSPQSPI